MKINKYTSALVGLGIISLASAAQAQTVIYLTGSTAARAIIYNAATTAGEIFQNDSNFKGVISGTAYRGNGANQIAYEGDIGGNLYILDCDFTGSEAGIASVAGQPLTQTVNDGSVALSGVGANTTANLPGVGSLASFLISDSGAWDETQALPINAGDGRGSVSLPDLSMADTSQAVSQTPKTLYNLKDYGMVGIVPFTLLKGYQGTPDAAWGRISNVTTAQINQAITKGDSFKANYFTGSTADESEYLGICGRNIGSGTRANGLLNFGLSVNAQIDQTAYNASYNASGVLQGPSAYTAPATVCDVGTDGYDSGSSVAKQMEVDGSGNSTILIGYLGVSDAQGANNVASAANTAPTGGGLGTPLTFNGVYESDQGVINGSYSYWGEEHLLGSIGQTTPETTVGSAIVTGITADLTRIGAGTATGDFSTWPKLQSILLPVSTMQVHRGRKSAPLDTGYPTQGAFPN